MKSLLVQAAAREQYRILVADDTPIIRSVFQSLPTTELQVRAIVTDRQALIRAVTNSPDIDAVLCADHLSGAFGGAQALTELRTRRALPHSVAFILMSGDARKTNLMANIEARPDGILLKPFAPGVLIQKLEALVTSRRALAPLRELADQQNWPDLLRVATDMLNNGTRYRSAVDQLKLEAASRMGTPESALATYRAQLAKNPDSPAILDAMARLAFQLEDFDEATRSFGRLVALQPANLPAADLLVESLLACDDRVGAQRQLQQAVRLSPNGAPRYRLLGHLALLNGDTHTAQRAYLAALRQQRQAHGLDEVDVVNAVRAALLDGGSSTAWQLVTDSRKALPDSVVLEVLERLVEAVMYREFEAFSRTQQRITEAITLLKRPIVQNVGVLTLAAIEACLIVLLVHRGYTLSRELINDGLNSGLHELQVAWAQRLNKWAVDAEDDELPKGMHHYHKFMK
jgi:CheY-like chemotaxis protein/Flp pilus assembly protein TadD